MNAGRDRGMVLVACILILAILSLLGAGSLVTAGLDTQRAANHRVNREAFYAAEAALEVGLGRVMNAFRSQLRPYIPPAVWTTPAGPPTDPYTNPFNGYTTEYRISNALNPANPGSLPLPFLYRTVENNQEMLHFAYTYDIEARSSSSFGAANMTESLRVLETPLVQYYIFFDDHLSWHPGPAMNSWGRIHTNQNLYVAPEPSGGITFRNYDDGNQRCPNTVTTSGSIIYGQFLNEGGGGTSARGGGTIRVRVDNSGAIPAAPGVFQNVAASITPANRGDPLTGEPKFVDVDDGVYHVRVGINPLPAPSFQTLSRGGFYETEASGPSKPGVDAFRILSDGGALRIWLSLNGGAPVEVTARLRNYEVDTGVYVSLATWPNDARTRANNTVVASTTTGAAIPTAMIPGTILYSPEAIVTADEAGATTYTSHRTATGVANPWYPSVLERRDPRENREVDLTVIDLQRLELWYRDYLDYRDNAAVDGSNSVSTSAMNPGNRNLLIYVSRSGAPLPTAGALQAVKLIGSRAGRTRNNATDRQSAATLLTRTTLVTDNALYLDGDFNAPAASAGDVTPSALYGCALLSDATTLLSNAWGSRDTAGTDDIFGQTGGVYTKSGTTASAYNAAFFTGRFNFRTGGSGEEAGVHNFLRFVESWGTACNISGCLINLWFSQQATGEFRCCGSTTADVYNPPQRNFGWDVRFLQQNYWPPYVPSIFSVERSVWREQ